MDNEKCKESDWICIWCLNPEHLCNDCRHKES